MSSDEWICGRLVNGLNSKSGDMSFKSSSAINGLCDLGLVTKYPWASDVMYVKY